MNSQPTQPKHGMRTALLWFMICLLSAATAQDFKIALILPFQSESTLRKIEDFENASDAFTANRIKLNEDAITALDFFQGALTAAEEQHNKIKLYVYDCFNSDSVTEEILKKPELKEMNVIIGATSASNARLVADYCNREKIINIQPFSPSRSLAKFNPYHIKLAPTIEAHIEGMFNSITENYPGANIIIYSSSSPVSKSAAATFDSLFAAYNKTASVKFTVSALNSSNMTLNGKKTTCAEQLKAGRKNIWIVTSFEESFLNGNFRVLYDAPKSYDLVVYGMPTWLNGEILRLDYVNHYKTHLSESFYPDSTDTSTLHFISTYENNFHKYPGKTAFLGYDVLNFTAKALTDFGTDFAEKVVSQRYKGAAYKFDIRKHTEGGLLSYYENTHINVFKVENYRLVKVW